MLKELYNSLHLLILWLGNGHRSANFLRLWALAKQKVDLGPYSALFLESNSIVGWICRQAESQRLHPGQDKGITDNLDPAIKFWLARRGITTDEDIQIIEKYGGDLITGLLMFLRALPRSPKVKGGLKRCSATKDADRARCRAKKTHKHESVPFDKADYDAIKQYTTEKNSQRESAYQERLAPCRRARQH